MLNRLIDWFDNRYSPVALAKDPQPPMGLWKFTAYFIGQFRTAYILRVILVAIGSIADAMMPMLRPRFPVLPTETVCRERRRALCSSRRTRESASEKRPAWRNRFSAKLRTSKTPPRALMDPAIGNA